MVVPSTLLAGAYAGGTAGVILTLIEHVAPRFGAGNFIRDLDEPQVLGRKITHREAHFIGILVHLLMSITSGVLFAYGVEWGWISGFHVLPMLGFATLVLLVSGGVLMPLEGHGFFGIKHDAWFIVDALITNLLWGGLYLVLVPLWI